VPARHHPLLPGGGHALDLRLDGAGRFLTGQNGVGKSTLLRALGLNAVLAAAFGLCHARSARLMVACHHGVLAALLRNELGACGLRRHGDGPAAGPVLEAGVLSDTNGIALMRQQGFDPRLVDEAFVIARWLGDYLTHPSEPPPGLPQGGA
jgi:hypothetical protein